MRSFLTTLLLLTGSAAGRAQDGPAILAVASIRVSEIWDSEQLQPMRKMLDINGKRMKAAVVKATGLELSEIDRLTIVLLKSDGDAQHVLVLTPRKPLAAEAIAKRLGVAVKAERGKWMVKPEYALIATEQNMIAVGEKNIIAMMVQPNPTTNQLTADVLERVLKRDEDRAAWLANEKMMGTLSFDVAELLAMRGEEFDENGQPRPIPEPMQHLSKARVATLNWSIGKVLTVRGEMIFTSVTDAEVAKSAAESLLKLAFNALSEPMDKQDTPEAKAAVALSGLAVELLKAGQVTQKEKTITVQTSHELTPAMATLLGEGVVILEAAAAKAQSLNNLKQIALAGHSYHDANGIFLQNICDEKGKSLLSWRVALLPYIEQNELYEQFKLDEPWDSEHNKKLIPKMPKVYLVPTAKESQAGMTYYQTFNSTKNLAERPLLMEGKGVSMAAITDGTSNTLMVVEAADAVTWTKPDDLVYNGDGKLPKFGGHFDGIFHAAMCDGSVRPIKTTLDPKTIIALITINGGEVVALDD